MSESIIFRTDHKLLIDEPPLLVLPTLAELIGLNEAVVLQQVHYWLQINRKAQKKEMFINDRWWTYGSYPKWRETNFRFWSESTVKRTFLSLEDLKLLISAQFSEDKRDRSKWYTIDYEQLDSMPSVNGASGQNDLINQINLTSSSGAKRPDDSKETLKETREDIKDSPAQSAEGAQPPSAKETEQAKPKQPAEEQQPADPPKRKRKPAAPKAPKPARAVLPKDVQIAIGVHVLGYSPDTKTWASSQWSIVNAKVLADALIGYNLTIDEVRNFKRWYDRNWGTRYTSPNVMNDKIPAYRADIASSAFTLLDADDKPIGEPVPEHQPPKAAPLIMAHLVATMPPEVRAIYERNGDL